MEFSDKVSKSHPGKYRIQRGKCSVCACVFRTSKDSEDDGYPTSKQRRELGESLASVRKFDVPLAQATTSSLDDSKTYGLALSTWIKKENWLQISNQM
jgi:hypothetical protein